MEIKNLLPIGSVVLLKDAQKKIMVFGVKQTNMETDVEYDYIGVLYPEGNLGGESQLLFQHEDIEKVYFTGYEDEERQEFIENLAGFYAQQEEN